MSTTNEMYQEKGVNFDFYQNYQSCKTIDEVAQDVQCVIADINVIVKNKVVEITFVTGSKEKMVCHEDDTFDLRKCCFIAIAKHLYKKEYTYEGIEYMAEQLMYQKKYVKIVDAALKAFAKKEAEKEKAIKKAEEEKAIRERQRKKRFEQKQRRAQRHKEALVDLIADSINEAKERRKANA